jgi:spermidine synthase
MSTPVDISERSGVRYLHFGSEWIQGAMRLRRPNALELAYTREMMAGLLLRDGLDGDGGMWPRRVLIIGLGAASILKFIYYNCPWARLDVVEIEPAVVGAAMQFFCLPGTDERLAIHIADGARHVLDNGAHYDYVLVDGYDRYARAGALDTLPFHQAVRARLSEHGLAAYNLFGHSRGYATSIERVMTAFDARAIAFPSCDGGNVVAFAAAGAPLERHMAELRTRAAILKARTGLDLLPTLSRLEAAGSIPGGTLIL